MRMRERKSFTLVEALMVIAVAVILAIVLFPAMIKNGEIRKSAMCLSNLKQIGLAFHMYSQDNEGKFPADAGSSNVTLEGSLELLKGYLDDPEVFICPISSDTAADSITNLHPVAEHCSYAFFLGLYKTADTNWAIVFDDCANACDGQSQATNEIELAAADNHGQDGVNILYVDGHVKWKAAGTDKKIYIPCGTNAYIRVAH